MKINTRYTTAPSGAGRIVAKGAGKQRTLAYDPAHSPAWNHGTAAGTLAKVLGLGWHDGITHEDNGIGHHTFAL